MQNSENFSSLSERYKILFEFLERDKRNSRMGRVNKWIEPYGSNYREIKSNGLLFLIWMITRSNYTLKIY